MLNDRERETLRDVQSRFMAEDPDFARSFETVGRPGSDYSLQWMHEMPPWVYTTAFVVAVTLAALMLLAQAPGTAFWFAVVATAIGVARHRRNDAGGADG
jgi:Protein of unknown function (DUF3040)